MSATICLRRATLDDAPRLLAWRNDPQTRAASHQMEEVSLATHLAWLNATLNHPERQLWIAEEAGQPVGTVRAAFTEGAWELAWTVAPEARGRGIAKAMVVMVAGRIAEPLRAKIKAGNLASARVAEHAGLSFQRAENQVLHYARRALS